jgi:hypothetical protein
MSKERIDAVIYAVLRNVYHDPGGCRNLVAMHLSHEREDVAPQIAELETRVAKLEEMLFWSYSFSTDQVILFDELENSTLACGGRPPNPLTWGLDQIEDDYDSSGPHVIRRL